MEQQARRSQLEMACDMIIMQIIGIFECEKELKLLLQADAAVSCSCEKDVYGQGCSEGCNMWDTCSGHGRCSGDDELGGDHALCVCFSGWAGENCSIKVDFRFHWKCKMHVTCLVPVLAFSLESCVSCMNVCMRGMYLCA